MLNRNFQVLALLTLVFGLANCTKSASDLIPSGSAPAPSGTDVVRQQGLSGEYLSDCISNPIGGMRTISLTATPQGVTIETVFYNGEECSAVDSKETLKGHLEDGGAKGDYRLVKFNIPVNANVSTWRYYNMKFSDGLIKISEFGMDPSDLNGAKPSIDLKRVAGTPPPSITPAPGTSAALDSGDYELVSGHESTCSQNVGVQTQGNAVTGLFVTFLSPCSGGSASFVCQTNGVCTDDSDDYRITILSKDSYRFENLSAGWSAQLQRQ